MSNYTYQQIPPAYSEVQQSSIDIPNDPIANQDVFKIDCFVSETDISIRMAFIRKVYSILTMQLLGTVVSAYLVSYNETVKSFFMENPVLLISSFILGLISLITLNFKAKSYPLNVILLSTFTLSESVLVGFIVLNSSATAVFQALVLTLGIFIGLTVFTIQSKYDFSQMGPILMFGIWGLVLLIIVQMFIPFGSAIELGISVFAVFLFSGYIIYDTYMIMNRYTPDDYIIASVSLYLDIINLFIYLLRILDRDQ
ncbi:hypothetical protein BB559_002458 [Furculomyces boomerangus]|uniref:Uncharacterized protein n=2 Tax=Harpellales TaxID=61421 RepID=A0A2T9YV57_9FUNG|nr:hypothetical protein BB559_002458 [Furculomyces boomerangus]PVZ98640.1 hypothetical protein BB558_005355 [Smittium angustum]